MAFFVMGTASFLYRSMIAYFIWQWFAVPYGLQPIEWKLICAGMLLKQMVFPGSMSIKAMQFVDETPIEKVLEFGVRHYRGDMIVSSAVFLLAYLLSHIDLSLVLK